MSEQLIASLNQRVSSLERENEKLAGECRKRKEKQRETDVQVEALTKERDALTRERDDFKSKAETGPKELRGRVDELTGQIRDRDHRDAWREAMGDQLAAKASVEDVWAKLGHKPGEAMPTPDEISEWVGKAREAAPYLFKPAGEMPADAPDGAQHAGVRLTPTGAPPGNGRGVSPHGSARFTVKMSETMEPGWQQKNPEKTKAIAEGRAVFVPE